MKKSVKTPRAMTSEGRTADGQPINAGDIFITACQRLTTPYPRQKSARYASQWLIENAAAIAGARGNEHAQRLFATDTLLRDGSLPQASVESMTDYLFRYSHL